MYYLIYINTQFYQRAPLPFHIQFVYIPKNTTDLFRGEQRYEAFRKIRFRVYIIFRKFAGVCVI